MSTARTAFSPAHALPSTWNMAVPAAIAAGALLGVVYTLSPMTVWFTAISAVMVWLGARGLPPAEARWIRGLLVAAIVVRVAIVAWLFEFGTPDHMWFNTFFGDEQYLIVRALRLRHLWLGSPLSLEAFSDVYDSYGRTSYLNVIAFAQLVTGPSPYGVHLLNAALYVTGAVVLHRTVRASFGPVAAAGSLFGTLFFPTLLIWSVSGLKESLNSLVVMGVMAGTIGCIRARWTWRPLAFVAVVAGLAALRTFRAGAFEITAAGIAVGLAGRVITRRVWRMALVAIAVLLLAAPVGRNARVQSVALRALRPAARMHMGHVFTRGHSYKLLDQRLYDPRVIESMTWPEAVRFIGRAAASVMLYPTPWGAQSSAELLYMPEQIAWYAILATALVGAAVGMRRDALVTSLFVGYSVTALMIVALNTGNVGTLVRHRSFALPFLIALSAVGVAAIVGRLSALSSPARS